MPRTLTAGPLAALFFAACAGEPAGTPEVGLDAGVDAGTDGGLDAGMWPVFAPHLQVSHPEVVCAPWPVLRYRGPTRPAGAPGELRFVHSLSADPAVARNVHNLFTAGGPTPGLEISHVGMTGLPNGGVSVVIRAGRMEGGSYLEAAEVGLDANGTFEFALVGAHSALNDPSHWFDPGPYPLARAPHDQLLRDLGGIGDGIHFGTRIDGPDIAIAHYEFYQEIAESRPAVFVDRGIVVWVAYNGMLVSSCLDGQIRWILDYDPHHTGSTFWASDPQLLGMPDGSVVADIGITIRVSESGEILAQWPRGYDGISPDCGARSLDEAGNPVWLDLDTLRPRGPAPPVVDGTLLGSSLGTSCQFVQSMGTTPPHLARMRSIGTNATSTWTIEIPAECGYLTGPMIPLEGGGFVGVCSLPGVIALRSDGSIDWMRAFGSHGPAGFDTVFAANVLMPDGTLYFATTSNVLMDGGFNVVAVETGARPAWQTSSHAAGNWARTSAPIAMDPPADAGVRDAALPDAATDAASDVDAWGTPDAGADAG